MQADALHTDDRLTVSIAEACRLTGLGRSSVYDLANQGKIRTTKVGSRRLVVVASLRELVAEDAA